jgi:hypothetical protein
MFALHAKKYLYRTIEKSWTLRVHVKLKIDELLKTDLHKT